MPLTVPAYFAAACRYGTECGRPTGGPCGVGGDGAGRGITDTRGVQSGPTSHGSPTANACAANGQSCLPGCVTTAHLIPLALPVAQSELAAAFWSFGLAAAFTTLRGRDDCVGPLMSSQPATPE